MYNLIPQLIIILALAGIIVIFARRLPEAKKEAEKEAKTQSEFFEVPKLRLKIFSFQKEVLIVLEKLGRRLSVFMLKLANISSYTARNLKQRSEGIRFIPKISKSYFARLRRAKSESRLSPIEKEYINLIKKDPGDIEAYRRLGMYYWEKGNYEDVKLSFNQILKLNPEDEDAKEKLKEIRRLSNQAIKP